MAPSLNFGHLGEAPTSHVWTVNKQNPQLVSWVLEIPVLLTLMLVVLRRAALNVPIGRGLSSETALERVIMEMKTFKQKPKGAHKKKYAAPNITLQVLGSGAPGAPESVCVVAGTTRYMFNCGEGTQRLANEHKAKLSKLEHIFFTKSSWKNFGGLPGMCLTLRDSGVTNITLHGPPQFEEVFTLSKSFIALGDLNRHIAPLNEPFEDLNLRVTSVPIDRDPLLAPSSNEEEEDSILAAKKLCRNAPGSDQSIAYVCNLHATQGQLMMSKCDELKVPRGPLLGKLKAGIDVTLHDGTLVRAKDVVSPDHPGSIFIVVECPDESYLDALVSRPEFAKHQSADPAESACVVVHFSPPEVMRLPKYKAWMDQFAASTTHLVVNKDNFCQGTTAVHRLQHKLHLVHPEIFPLLKDVPERPAEDNRVQGNSLVKINLRPMKGIDLTSRLLINPDEYIQESLDEEGFKEELESLKRKLLIADVKGPVYPKITFLGTGSCIPNKTRNTSGILVQTSKDCCFMMDCGEATASQLVRMYGLDEANRLLRALKGVYVSHQHADHHIGLVGVILHRRAAFKSVGLEAPKLPLLLPLQVIPFVTNYSDTFEDFSKEIAITKIVNEGSEEYSAFKAATGLKNLKTCFVKHCSQAFGALFEHESGWKLVYSGDTEPCPDLIEMGRDCDVLIHEATMEDGLEDEARDKRHSTTSEAIKVGQDMGAKFTLLTHFSQRYSKIPIYNDKFSDTIGIAFDNMQVSFSQLHLLPVMMPTLKKMFSKYHEEMEERMELKILKKRKRDRILEEFEKKKLVDAFTK